MNRSNKPLDEFIRHILIGIEKIERHTKGLDLQGFIADDLIQDAVIRNLEVVGEASKNILKHYPEFSTSRPEIQLSAAYQMRNAVSHGYFAVDLKIVWSTVERSIPELKGSFFRLARNSLSPPPPRRQRIENPCVGRSIPPRATRNLNSPLVGLFSFRAWQGYAPLVLDVPREMSFKRTNESMTEPRI